MTVAACHASWADTALWLGLAFAFAICYAAWRFTGGKHLGERHRGRR